MTKYGNSQQISEISQSKVSLIGSINALSNLVKLTQYYADYIQNITGDINIACINWSKLRAIYLGYVPYINGANNLSARGDGVYGDIAVFGNKYDIIGLQLYY